MAHDSTHPTPGDPSGFDWNDPHAFHHDAEGHADDHGHGHITSWQKLLFILFVLLFLTALTVAAATAEAWAVGMGVNITHFWNVVIALTIALVKATLVCMYFMHLKHDNPLNTMILLTTLFVFGLFLVLTGIDVHERGRINPFKADYNNAGGTGVGMVAGGGSLGDNITTIRKKQEIERRAAAIAQQHGRDEANDEDKAAAGIDFWGEFYHHKLEDHHGEIPYRHIDDVNDVHADWLAHHIDTHGEPAESDGDRSRPRHGLTPGLFDAHAPHGGGHDAGHGENQHGNEDDHDNHSDHDGDH